jgi:hypothetical protein
MSYLVVDNERHQQRQIPYSIFAVVADYFLKASVWATMPRARCKPPFTIQELKREPVIHMLNLKLSSVNFVTT